MAAGWLSNTFFPAGVLFAVPLSLPAIFVVKEAEVKAKHQQIISGVSLLAYWLSNYIWDLFSYLAPMGITLVLLYAFGIDSYTKGQAALAMLLVLLSFAPAVASLTYLLSFMCKSHSAAQNGILFQNFLTGLILSITNLVLTIVNSTRPTALKLRYVFRLFPAFCFGDSLLQLSFCVEDICPTWSAEGLTLTNIAKPLSWDVTLANIVFLLVEALLFFLLTLLVEYGRTFPQVQTLFSCMGWRTWMSGHGRNGRGRGQGQYGALSQEEEDEEEEDVANEERRVMSGGANGDVVRLEKLRKVYHSSVGDKVAVQGLSFGIPKGECFGFLGINGAGTPIDVQYSPSFAGC